MGADRVVSLHVLLRDAPTVVTALNEQALRSVRAGAIDDDVDLVNAAPGRCGGHVAVVDDIGLRERFAGSVLLLYAQPLTRIAQLGTGDITTADGGEVASPTGNW